MRFEPASEDAPGLAYFFLYFLKCKTCRHFTCVFYEPGDMIKGCVLMHAISRLAHLFFLRWRPALFFIL